MRGEKVDAFFTTVSYLGEIEVEVTCVYYLKKKKKLCTPCTTNKHFYFKVVFRIFVLLAVGSKERP